MRGARGGWLLACALAVFACACKAALRGGLSEVEANQIVVALEAADIPAAKAAGPGAEPRFEVRVTGTDVARALALLERDQLPRPPHAGFDTLYAETGLVAAPAEERARWAAATSGELGRSIERFAGVVDARVHLSLPEARAALDAPEAPAKASVLVRRRAGAPPIDEPAVRALVAGALDGLDPERVSVIQVAQEPAPARAAGLLQVGPISVTRASAGALKAVLGTALGLDLVLAVALVALWRARRRERAPGAAPE